MTDGTEIVGGELTLHGSPHRQLTVVVWGRPPTLNSRRDWHTIAEDNAEWKSTTTVVATEARRKWETLNGLRWPPLRHATMKVLFYLPDHRRRDVDNLISSLKPEIDGLVAAGIVIDDSVEVIRSISFGWHYGGKAATAFVVSEADDG